MCAFLGAIGGHASRHGGALRGCAEEAVRLRGGGCGGGEDARKCDRNLLGHACFTLS